MQIYTSMSHIYIIDKSSLLICIHISFLQQLVIHFWWHCWSYDANFYRISQTWNKATFPLLCIIIVIFKTFFLYFRFVSFILNKKRLIVNPSYTNVWKHIHIHLHKIITILMQVLLHVRSIFIKEKVWCKLQNKELGYFKREKCITSSQLARAMSVIKFQYSFKSRIALIKKTDLPRYLKTLE